MYTVTFQNNFPAPTCVINGIYDFSSQKKLILLNQYARQLKIDSI